MTASIEPRDGERWAEVSTPDGEGPYRALVHTDPQRDFVLNPLFPLESVRRMVRDFDPHMDIYGGLEWARDGHTVLIYENADDVQPRRVIPDERGLYDLGLDDSCWVEDAAGDVETDPHTAAVEAAEEADLSRREREHDDALNAIDRYGYGS